MAQASGKLTDAQRMDLVQRYVAGQSMTCLSVLFGVSRQAIGGLLRRRGIAVRPQAKLTEAQRMEAIERYNRGQNSTQIAVALGVSDVTILGVLNRRGVAVRRRCTLRHDALDEITPEGAYWCGFLFADGNVHRRSPQQQPVLSIAVAERDRDHLVKLRSFLGSTHMISTASKGQHPSYQFRAASARLSERLCGLGRYEGPIAPELADSRHFWRGLVDGDGSLGCYPKRQGGAPKAQFRLCGERRMLLAFVNFLHTEGTTGANLSVRPHKTIHNVGTTGWTAVRIIELLYSNAPVALDRKADAARLIIRKYSKLPTADLLSEQAAGDR